MTEDHTATLGGQDSSFKLQLKWISASPTPPPPYLAPSFSHSLPGLLMYDVAFPNTELRSNMFCFFVLTTLAHTLIVNTAGCWLTCARNLAKHVTCILSL